MKHISEVWELLERAKDETELNKLIGEIQFGIFTYEMLNDTTARVTNTYEENGDTQEDIVDIDLKGGE